MRGMPWGVDAKAVREAVESSTSLEEALDKITKLRGGRKTTRAALDAWWSRNVDEKKTAQSSLRVPAADMDSTLYEYASPGDAEVLGAVHESENYADAAEKLGTTEEKVRNRVESVRRKSAWRGYSPRHDMVRPVPDGFHVKGVSTYYNREGKPSGQWVKSNIDADARLQALRDALTCLAEPFKGLAKPSNPPKISNDDLLCVYPMGDPHLGLYAWHEETGEDFDLEIAESTLVAAVDRLVDLAPPASEALIVNLGDFFHSDSNQNRTARSGHALDVDTRWAKVLRAGIRTTRRNIDRALEKHARVRYVAEIGNHDPQTSIMLALCIANFYERDERVTVDTSPSTFHWYRFGECLLGITHGDNVKPDKLPLIMAHDRPEDWGETRHRHWYCGHIHHETVKEHPGVTVESFRTLAARDAWHHQSGYRSRRDMRVDVWHRTYGRITRHIVGIEMLEGLHGRKA